MIIDAPITLTLKSNSCRSNLNSFDFCTLTFNGDLPATENQIEYLKTLQEVIPEDIDFENLTRQEAFRIYYFKDYSSGIRKQDGELAPAKIILA